MTSYLKFNQLEKEEVLNLRNLWNDELGFIFPITEELFNRNTYLTNGFLLDCSYVAMFDNIPVGFIISKVWNTTKVDGLYENTGWISLIYVSKKYRKQGIGSKLISLVESDFKDLGISKINLGKDYQNFFPGLPKDLKEHLDWFTKRGYTALYETNDLVNLNLNQNLLNLEFKSDNKYDIRLCTKDDFPELIRFMEKNFPGRWLVELKDYIKNNGTGCEFVVCVNNKKRICGFCKIGSYKTPIELISFSLTWRDRFLRLGGIGPLGVDSDFRRQNIAYNMIVFSVNYLKSIGSNALIIDWTNLISFYRKFGFEIWKTYIYIEKNLNL